MVAKPAKKDVLVRVGTRFLRSRLRTPPRKPRIADLPIIATVVSPVLPGSGDIEGTPSRNTRH